MVLATGRVAAADYDEADFAIRYRQAGDGPESGRIFLDNVFRETAGADRQTREQRIRRLVDGVVGAHSIDDGWESVRPKLRPVMISVTPGLPEARA